MFLLQYGLTLFLKFNSFCFQGDFDHVITAVDASVKTVVGRNVVHESDNKQKEGNQNYWLLFQKPQQDLGTVAQLVEGKTRGLTQSKSNQMMWDLHTLNYSVYLIHF